MGRPPPLPDDDDDEDDDVKPRRRPPPLPVEPGAGAASVWQILKWVMFGIGVVLCIVALDQPAVRAAAFAGLGCFAGIAARIAQAEEHHLRGKK